MTHGKNIRVEIKNEKFLTAFDGKKLKKVFPSSMDFLDLRSKKIKEQKHKK